MHKAVTNNTVLLQRLRLTQEAVHEVAATLGYAVELQKHGTPSITGGYHLNTDISGKICRTLFAYRGAKFSLPFQIFR